MKKIIINKSNQDKTVLLLENKNIVEKYVENKDSNKIEGNIYIGKIESVLPGMQAAFIDIGLKKNTFIHLQDMLPKVDVVNNSEKINKEDIKKVARPRTTNISTSKKRFYKFQRCKGIYTY